VYTPHIRARWTGTIPLGRGWKALRSKGFGPCVPYVCQSTRPGPRPGGGTPRPADGSPAHDSDSPTSTKFFQKNRTSRKAPLRPRTKSHAPPQIRGRALRQKKSNLRSLQKNLAPVALSGPHQNALLPRLRRNLAAPANSKARRHQYPQTQAESPRPQALYPHPGRPRRPVEDEPKAKSLSTRPAPERPQAPGVPVQRQRQKECPPRLHRTRC
jgi:hypothetical protein